MTHRGPLRAAASVLLGELEQVLRSYVMRLRTDPVTPRAHGVDDAILEDHLATFLADLAGTLEHMELGTTPNPGEPVLGVLDSSAIQRVVSERHGVQRARLGWTESEVAREHVILREEITGLVRRRASVIVTGGEEEGGDAGVQRALAVMLHLLATAERHSLASFRRAAGAESTSGR